MFARIFIKEWRDNILLFILGLTNLVAAFGLFLFGENKPGLYVSGLFLFFILPLLALLLGASAFQSELRDNSWTYIFSRPVTKPGYWAMKFVSQLSLVAVLVALFFAFKAAVPASTPFLADLNFPTRFFQGGPALFIVPSLLAFTVAFSLSFLTDRPFIIFFLSMLIMGALVLLVPRFQMTLWLAYFHGPGMSLLIGLVFASFILASVIVFSRSDLSQRARAAVRIAVLIFAFLALTAVAQWFIAARGNPFRTQREYISAVSVSPEGTVLIDTLKRGLIEYDPATGETRPVSRFVETYDSPVSFASGKAAFVETTERSRTRFRQDVRVVGLKDLNEVGKVDLYGPDAPLRGQWLVSNVLLSPDGERIALVGASLAVPRDQRTPVLYVMRPDGTRLTPRPLPLPPGSKVKILGWMRAEDSLILLASDRFHPEKECLVKFNLETQSVQQTAAQRAVSFLSLSRGVDYALYELKGETDRSPTELVLLDLRTFQPRVLMTPPPGDSVQSLAGLTLNIQQSSWTTDGRFLGFCDRRDVYRYALPDGPLTRIPQTLDPKYSYSCAFTWVEPGGTLAIFSMGRTGTGNDMKITERSLKLYDSEDRLTRTLSVPRVSIWNNTWSAGNAILVRDWGGGLWRLDLKTEEWKKIY